VPGSLAWQSTWKQEEENYMIIKYKGINPKIHESCFIAPSADIIGKVEIGENSSIWFKAVLRGDIASIIIGKNTNIQDGCIIHCGYGIDTVVGDGVVVGHNAVLHGCQIGDNCLIGMGAIVLNEAKIGENCIIGAGALITLGKQIPPNSLVLGSPAKVIRELTQEEIQSIAQSAQRYVNHGREYK
jgi:carbonic anhydrase/acetyltransferase-like protein (isoleucine patch superfamily)